MHMLTFPQFVTKNIHKKKTKTKIIFSVSWQWVIIFFLKEATEQEEPALMSYQVFH